MLSVQFLFDDDLKKQYREFLKRLEESTQQYQPDSGLFVDIEMVMQAISVCCVKVSCESVLESLVSVFENHFDPRRNMKEESTTEESTTEEFVIAVNGSVLAMPMQLSGKQ